MSKTVNEDDVRKVLGNDRFFWETDYPRQIPKITCKEIFPNSKGWVLNGVFTPLECQKLIDMGNRIGYESLKDEYAVSYRNNLRFMLSSPSLANEMFKRIKDYIPEELHNGSWKLEGLNDYFRCCKYNKGGIFGIHQDSSYKPEPKRRSYYTCMLYLNKTQGGNTRFYDDIVNRRIVAELPPAPGQVLLFDPDIWHDGAKVYFDEKYIVRTEVMYGGKCYFPPATPFAYNT